MGENDGFSSTVSGAQAVDHEDGTGEFTERKDPADDLSNPWHHLTQLPPNFWSTAACG